MNNIYAHLQEHLQYALKNKQCKDYFGIFVFGSQNYGLSDMSSDVDSRLVYFPSQDDPSISQLTTADGKEMIELISIDYFLQCLCEGFLPILEALTTQFYIINPRYETLWQEIVKRSGLIIQNSRDKIIEYAIHYAEIQVLRFLKNEGQKKEGAFYTIKPLMHLIRTEDIVDKVISGKGLDNMFIHSDPQKILTIKHEALEYQEAEKQLLMTYQNILLKAQAFQFIKHESDESFWRGEIYPILNKIIQQGE